MKFKDSEGVIYPNLRDAIQRFLSKSSGYPRLWETQSGNYMIWLKDLDEVKRFLKLLKDNPEEAAKFMGYEIIDE